MTLLLTAAVAWLLIPQQASGRSQTDAREDQQSAESTSSAPALEPSEPTPKIDVSSEAPLEMSAPWTTFRGGSLQRGWRRGSVAATPRLVWVYDAESAVESTAAIDAGRVFIGSDEKGILALALDAKSDIGELLWTFPNEFGVQASPAVKGDRVYFGDILGVFWCISATTGKELWKLETESGAEILSSVSFDRDRVLFGSYDATLYCLRADDGKPVWTFTTEGPVHGSPAVAAGHTFVAGCDEQLRIVSLTDGKEVGAVPMGGNNAGSPAIVGERLFVGTLAEEVLCVNWREIVAQSAARAAAVTPLASGSEAATDSTTSERETPSGERASPGVIWRYNPPRSFQFYASPAVGRAKVKGKESWVVVIGGRDKLVHAIDADSGEAIWTFPTKAKVDSSPVIIGDRVAVGGLDGNVYLLDLESGKEIWSYAAGSKFQASPAVADGRLVITSSEGLVHCFDLRPQTSGNESR